MAKNNDTVSEEIVKAKKESLDLEELGYYLLMDDITSESVKDIMEWILRENLNNKHKLKELTLIIHSYGGSLTAAFALIDIMRGSSIPVRTVGVGAICSAGLLIFMSGAKGKRILTPNTSILSHQWAWGAWGKEHELFAKVKEYELTTERIIAHYIKCTGLKEKDVRKYLLPPEDRWISANEAKKLGICDEVKDMKGV